MFYVKKRMEIAGAHKLKLSYKSKCENLHGHNWIITVFCKSEELNENGMVVDFADIKKILHDELDHKNLNEIFEFNPTAENIAKWIVEYIAYCHRAEVIESENNWAAYEV